MAYSGGNSADSGQVSMSEALGQSEAFIEFQEQISRVAPIDRPVLILGERGTGKELAAARVHFLSKRWQKPLVTLNCAALTPTLIGSELFGYEKGAFTGAGTRQTGRFEQAADGTLFLDEIGTIPIEVQEKILRVVEYGSFERVGSPKPVRVDVRIVAATNANLAVMADKGAFKRDLLDRLSFEVIYVPPLRYRKEDILLLARHFAGRMAFELGWEDVPDISAKARQMLEAYAWPGNIRELKNVVERAVYKSPAPLIETIDFNPFKSPFDAKSSIYRDNDNRKHKEQRTAPQPAGGLPADLLEKPLKESVRILEVTRMEKALEECRYNQRQAAKALGLSYDQFRGLKKRLGI